MLSLKPKIKPQIPLCEKQSVKVTLKPDSANKRDSESSAYEALTCHFFQAKPFHLSHILLCLLATMTVSCQQPRIDRESCMAVRAAIDVGSGTTKLKVAETNLCKQSISKILFSDHHQLELKKALSETSGRFPQATIDQATTIIKKYRDIARKFKASEIRAIATAAVRAAKNRKDFEKQIALKTGIKVKTISQEQEGILGFRAVAQALSRPAEDLITWDIGGGSMQVTTFKNKKYKVYKGEIGSVDFSEMIVTQVQGKKLDNSSSPNPITVEEKRRALRLAAQKAELGSAWLKQSIQSNDYSIVGLGNVHYNSLRDQIYPEQKKNSYTFRQLFQTLERRTGLSDEQIPSAYRKTEISNLILVAGFMKEWGIDRVDLVTASLTDGLLLAEEYW